MPKTTLTTILVSLISAATVSVSAAAEPDLMAGFYMGGGLNYTNLELDGEQSSILVDDSSVGYGVIAGFSLNPNIAFELGYKDFGTIEENYESGNSSDTELSATTLAMKINLPIDAGVGLFLGFGYGRYDGEFLFTDTRGTGGQKTEFDENGYFVQMGLRYAVWEKLSLGLSYQYHGFKVDNQFDQSDIGSVDSTLSEISMDAMYEF